MCIQAEYCSLTDICNKYPNCSIFSDHKWLKCKVYKKIRSWILNQSENPDENPDLEMECEYSKKSMGVI